MCMCTSTLFLLLSGLPVLVQRVAMREQQAESSHEYELRAADHVMSRLPLTVLVLLQILILILIPILILILKVKVVLHL